MRRLFLKVFLWFWAAMGVVGAALYLAVTTTTPDPLPEIWREDAAKSLAVYANRTRNDYEQTGAPAASQTLTLIEITGLRASLLDARGRTLATSDGSMLRPGDDFLHPPAPGNQDMRRGFGADGFGGGFSGNDGNGAADFAATFTTSAQAVFDRTKKSGHAEFEVAGRWVVLAQRVTSTVNANKTYVLFGTTRRPRLGQVPVKPSAQALRALVVFLTAGLVCYALVRHLTSPISVLRHATHQLAEGDLTARAGVELTRRRDELADLGRDFNTMAERLEYLLTSERRMVESQRRLLGDISHELRSPLARLSMALALARRHANGAADTANVSAVSTDTPTPGIAPVRTNTPLGTSLDRIGRETERLNTLIGQLLTLVRMESGDGSSTHASINLQDLVREVALDADFEAKGRHRRVEVLESEDCRIVGDPDLLRSAVENVVRNAITHTPENTVVEVTLQCRATAPPSADGSGSSAGTGQVPAQEAIIRVRDHGSGVPPEALPDLFRPFYRVESARDRGSGGVGLGLSITERAVRSHGGSVMAENAPDGGLRVEIRLPLNTVISRDARSKALG